MSNSYFDWPAKTASERFVRLDTWRAADANAALDEVSAGLEKLPAPYDINAGRASYGTDTGTADAYVVALQTKAAAQVTSLQAGLHVSFLATNTNTGASTINVNGLGAKSILRPDGATALTAGAIVAGQMVECRYDGAAFQLLTGTDGSWTQDPSAIQKQTYTAFTTGGTGSAYTLTPSPVLSAYQANVSFYVNFHAACGTGATLSISGTCHASQPREATR